MSYDVFIQNVYVTTLSNANETTILPAETSTIGLNILLNPEQVLKSMPNPLLSILDFKNLPLKIVMRFKINLGLFAITIPYTYEGAIKDFM